MTEKHIRRHTHRPPASRTWEVSYRWGSMIGDTGTLRVTNTAGRLVVQGDDRVEVRPELVAAFAEMVAEAAAWKDDPADPASATYGGDR